jgi:hypothetical protein
MISKRTCISGVSDSCYWSKTKSWGGNSWASNSWYTITITSTITGTVSEDWGSGSISSASSSQMFGSGSNNGWGISWGDSSVGVGYQTSSTCW